MKEMDKLGRGYRPKNGGHDLNELNGVGIGLNTHTLLIIKLPDSRSLRIISRSLFFAMVLLALPSLGSIIRASSTSPLYDSDANLGVSDGFKILPLLLRDLLDEGLIRKGHRGFVLGVAIENDLEFLREAGIDLLTGADLRQTKRGEHQDFDFAFVPSVRGIQLIDGIVEDGGLVISPLGFDPSDELRLLRNFKIVYLRRFENTMVAMRKTVASSNGRANSAAKQVFCGITPEKKQAALKGLEDVYLEPPRRGALAKKSSFTSRKIRFLPDLLKDSLDEYPRRIFISDDSNALDWFYKNYPMRDQEFEVYDIEVGTDNDGLSSQGFKPQESESDWIMKRVRPEDYVVMKAEAQVVEQMMRDKTLCLVDELFLECKNQWEDREEENGSKRAYWQCLELYGKVRDEGIAVHQWWY